MKRTSYAISWLYGEFRIARFYKGEVAEQWQAPELVESHAHFVRALDEAGRQIDLRTKGDVTVVHEHDLHSHDYLELPAMRKRDLEKFLWRRVQQDKPFAEDAAWCFHEVRHSDGQQGVLLHLLPKSVVEDTITACTNAGLAPKRYVPLTEIVSDYLPTTDVAATDLLLVLACFEQRTEIIVALGDGEALFVRELNYGANSDTVDRLITDVNRTIRYTRQQLRREVDTAWIMGHPEWTIVDRLRQTLEVPVHFDADAADPNFWSLWATRLSGKMSANFVSVFAQQNITQDVLRRAGVWSTAAVVVLAVLMTLFTTGLVAHRAEQIREISLRSDAVRATIDGLEQELSFGQTKQEHLQRLRASSQNLPSLMMLHLGRLTPADVTLTEVSIEQLGDGWLVAVSGLVSGDMRHGARVLAGFEDRLTESPWSLDLNESFRKTWMEQFKQGYLSEQQGLGFTIAGEIR
ncbi:MAG: hypothetical protein AAF993_12565 [Pseudomonadota bacterium]